MSLRRPVPKLKVAGVAIVVVLVFFLAPIVPYLNSVNVPGGAQQGPAGVWGFATLSYGLLGYGSPPYPSQRIVAQGNHSALVFFEGGRAVAIEDAGGPGVVLNPSSVIAVEYAAVSSSDWGTLNITFHLQNINYYNVTNAVVYVSMVGLSENGTDRGLTLIEPKPVGSCGTLWVSYDYCSVSQVAPNALPVNKSFVFYGEVRGTIEGAPFLYRQAFAESYPQGGIGPLWVQAFIGKVNQGRGGIHLSENSTLDRFAAIRFRDASAVFQISDYNLSQDASAFFGPSPYGNQISELLLFPGTFSPTAYPDFLSEYAPGHWTELSNTLFTQYGYYVGEASYYDVSIPCPVYEVPHAGVNITQFFHQQGCSTMVGAKTWLVMILGP